MGSEGGEIKRRRRRLKKRGCVGCNGPGLCLRAPETDLSQRSFPCVFLYIDSLDFQPHNSAEQTEKDGLTTEVDVVK